MFAWGDNSKKQVTNINEEVISVPVKICDALLSKRVVKISCGSHFSVVVTSDGIVSFYLLVQMVFFYLLSARCKILEQCSQNRISYSNPF